MQVETALVWATSCGDFVSRWKQLRVFGKKLCLFASFFFVCLLAVILCYHLISSHCQMVKLACRAFLLDFMVVSLVVRLPVVTKVELSASHFCRFVIFSLSQNCFEIPTRWYRRHLLLLMLNSMLKSDSSWTSRYISLLYPVLGCYCWCGQINNAIN